MMAFQRHGGTAAPPLARPTGHARAAETDHRPPGGNLETQDVSEILSEGFVLRRKSLLATKLDLQKEETRAETAEPKNEQINILNFLTPPGLRPRPANPTVPNEL